jgi:hypothetical protein
MKAHAMTVFRPISRIPKQIEIPGAALSVAPNFTSERA